MKDLWEYDVEFIDDAGQVLIVRVDAFDEVSALDIAADVLEDQGTTGRPVVARPTGQQGDVFPD